jgi:uncharacterized membrane protein required for colicin V production
VNELDLILIFIVLVGVGIGLRRGLVRVLISTIGIYLTVIVTGYAYEPMGDTLSGSLGELGIKVGKVEAHNFCFLLVVVAMTVAVELISRSTFEETRIRTLWRLDNVLGGLAGVFYGALWASLFLVPVQYSVAETAGAWSRAVSGSTLVPTLNRVFVNGVLDLVSIFFLDGTPELYLNRISQRVTDLFLFWCRFA